MGILTYLIWVCGYVGKGTYLYIVTNTAPIKYVFQVETGNFFSA